MIYVVVFVVVRCVSDTKPPTAFVRCMVSAKDQTQIPSTEKLTVPRARLCDMIVCIDACELAVRHGERDTSIQAAAGSVGGQGGSQVSI